MKKSKKGKTCKFEYSSSKAGILYLECIMHDTDFRDCLQKECSDNLDNDGDGATDYPSDFSCSSGTDTDETNPKAACQDGTDNDTDGSADYPNDAGWIVWCDDCYKKEFI